MKKLISSPISLLLIVLTAFASVSIQASPVGARRTLLSLYTDSDVIAIGRFDKREECGANRVGDGFVVVGVRTSFDISTVLKGEPRKFATVEDEEFRYQIVKNGIPRDAVFVDDNESRGDDQPKPGDTVLIFLKNAGSSLILTDDRDGIRKINAADVDVLSSRIKELNSIFDTDKPESSKIAAWLVRCAEHSATRWDGTHELAQGFRRIDWQQKPNENGYERNDPSVAYAYGADVANAVTAQMKASLTQILINSTFTETSLTPLLDGDRELVTLVKKWEPAAAAGTMITMLKSKAFTPHVNAGLMYKVSELLGDTQTARLSQRYSDIRSKQEEVLTPNSKQLGSLNMLLGCFIEAAEMQLSRTSTASSN